jgi:hypothetical protein
MANFFEEKSEWLIAYGTSDAESLTKLSLGGSVRREIIIHNLAFNIILRSCPCHKPYGIGSFL